MLLERREQRLYASHNQFYVQDANGGDTSDPSFWTEETTHDRLAVVAGVVGVGTGSYGYVRVFSEIHDVAPPLDLAIWDHVTKASLEVKSGTLRVIGCLDPVGEDFQVMPGAYRVRCCHANLAEATDAEDGEDWYLVQVWPAPILPPVLLKQWSADSERWNIQAMDEIWTRLETFLQSDAPAILDSLAPGATEEEIIDAEEFAGFQFPADVRQSSLRHDGQADEGRSFIPGFFRLLALSEMLQGIEENASLMQNINSDIPIDSIADPKVKRVFLDAAWVPFAGDSGGNRLSLDFAPTPKGTVGQIILWNHEETTHRCIAPNFTVWLDTIVSDFELGRLVWDEELEGYVYPES